MGTGLAMGYPIKSPFPIMRRSILTFICLSIFLYLAVMYFPILNAWGDGPSESWSNGQESAQSPAILGLIVDRNQPQTNSFGTFKSIIDTGPPLGAGVEPVNRDATIIIEKIGVNTPIVFDVPVGHKTDYWNALDKGVAHALGTAKPGEVGNTYLFAHSTAHEANIARYAAVFTKLDEVSEGNRIVIFYEGKRYDYVVESSEVVASFDTTPLLRDFGRPVLTLQTCYPRGVAKDRLIVTARLVGVFNE